MARFGAALIALLLLTSIVSFVVGVCSRKRHQLIRVHHRAGSVAAAAESAAGAAAEGGAGASREAGPDSASSAHLAPPVTAVTGPDGLIQPHVAGGLPYGVPAELAARYKAQGSQAAAATAIFGR